MRIQPPLTYCSPLPPRREPPSSNYCCYSPQHNRLPTDRLLYLLKTTSISILQFPHPLHFLRYSWKRLSLYKLLSPQFHHRSTRSHTSFRKPHLRKVGKLAFLPPTLNCSRTLIHQTCSLTISLLAVCDPILSYTCRRRHRSFLSLNLKPVLLSTPSITINTRSFHRLIAVFLPNNHHRQSGSHTSSSLDNVAKQAWRSIFGLAHGWYVVLHLLLRPCPKTDTFEHVR